ncbi:conjugative transposon protein TraM [Mucilaginibacter sp. UYCu711]|uniref:conjugative transposon protein TraM n=1 Tax=Mucilaginibacter sp. UYCu711 TaxID=3156339 RepID=UPI003D2214AC
MARQFTPEELLLAKKAQQKKIIIGVVVFVLIVFGFFGYTYFQAVATTADSSGSLVNQPNIDSANAPVVVDKATLYEAQREKARKDSMSRLAVPKGDSIMKMVNTPIISRRPEVKETERPAKIPAAPVSVVVPAKKTVAVFHPRKKKNLVHLPAMKAKPVQTEGGSPFNFVYNSGGTATAKSSLHKETETKTTTQSSGYGDYTSFKRETVKPILGEILKSQKVEDGDAVGIRMKGDLKVNDAIISEGTVIYGKASISGKRVNIQISNVKTNKGIISVNLQVLGDDMIQGVEANVREPKVDASGAPSQAVSIVTSQLGVVGSLLSSVRPRSSNIQYRTFSIEAGKQVYITGN